ncbi:MAG: YARHG domain-containing protein [Bacteroidetes bacterium]|nr:YARHG domain-containing protein [Bacteroidota bacterium]
MAKNYSWVFAIPALMIFSQCKNASAGKTGSGYRTTTAAKTADTRDEKTIAQPSQNTVAALPVNISSAGEAVNNTATNEPSLYTSTAEQQKHAAARKHIKSNKRIILTRGNFPEGSERKLTEWDVIHLSKWGYTIMLNEIYARHGLIFHDPSVAAYFKKVRWYKGRYKNVDKKLSQIERENIMYLKSTAVASMPRS